MSDTNNGTTYINRNVCRSFTVGLTTGLSALANQICSEVTILNNTGQSVLFYDGGFDTVSNGFLVEDTQTFTFRGLTNAMQLSAATLSGAGNLSYRTQYYSYSQQ